MIDGVGNVQRGLVIGGPNWTSMALASELVGPRLELLVLAGENQQKLVAASEEVRSWGVQRALATDFDPHDTASHSAVIDEVFEAGDIDVVVIADPVPPTSPPVEADPAAATALVATNLTATISAALNSARNLRRQGHGILVIAQHIAPTNPDQFLYDTIESALDVFVGGLVDSLHKSGVRVIFMRIQVADSISATQLRSALAATLQSRKHETVDVPSGRRRSVRRFVPRSS